MIDTHTHLYFTEDFQEENGTHGCNGAVERAIDAGVAQMVFPNVDLESVSQMLSLHHAFPDVTYVAAGLHPTEVGADWKAEMREIFDRMADEKYVAIGEVGIDLYHDASQRTRQMDAFGQQVQIAIEKNLPVIIHCRDGLDETLEILSDFSSATLPKMVFHSFTYGPEEARRVLEQTDAMFGINGVATFKNATNVREAVRLIGLDRIVLETDSPYLAPVPLRGRRNESSYLPHIAASVADTLAISKEEVEKATDRNAINLFDL